MVLQIAVPISLARKRLGNLPRLTCVLTACLRHLAARQQGVKDYGKPIVKEIPSLSMEISNARVRAAGEKFLLISGSLVR